MFCLQDGGKKPAGIDKKRNYVTVTLYVAGLFNRCFMRFTRAKNPRIYRCIPLLQAEM